jgi:lipopolysaccharide/colanic/teichoic acid biosynthesis glycosyltransferase
VYKFSKRTFDILGAFFGILFLLPLFAVVGLIIVLTSNGGAFFKQTRVGRKGTLFKILKFRTMTVNAKNPGRQITTKGDKRITRVGMLLRKTKIDELPQLFNILFGQMSFVGPRPEVPKYVLLYTTSQCKVLEVRPGITDLASLEYRNENDLLLECENPEEKYINEIMPAKLALNIKYIDERGFFYDLCLIFRTVFLLLKSD